MPNFYDSLIDHFDELKYALLHAQTFDPNHYGFPEIYYKIMETDRHRIGVFQEAFVKYDQLCDAVVCEVGVGRLALTQHYLPYVKKAYLIENNPNIIDFVRNTIREKGWESKVELIYGDALKVELPESVDYLIGELMSIYCANEYQVQIFKRLRKHLKPNGKLIPEKIVNMAQMTLAKFEGEHRHYPLLLTRHWPTTLSTQVAVNTIDFYGEEDEHIVFSTKTQALLSGKANSLLLNSWVQLTEGVNFTGTDSLMPPTVVKLEEEVEIKAGQTYTLHFDFTYGTSLDEAKFWVEQKKLGFE